MRLIDADETLNKLAEWQAAAYAEGDVFHNGVSQGLFDAITIITKAATIDPVKHGEWQHKEGCPLNYFECSLCGNEHVATFDHNDNFCSNCGAKMDGDNDA